MTRRPKRPTMLPRAAAAALVSITGVARAQDSTAAAPNTTDALSAYDTTRQRTLYAADLAPVQSSWGNTWGVAPVLKLPRDTDPLFRTQVAGALSASPGAFLNPTFPSRAFQLWAAPGVGIHPQANTAPASTVSVNGFTRQFALGVTGVSAGATNIIAATIGRRDDAPARLFIERTTALSSRASQSADDTATLALGALDSESRAAVRADPFSASAEQPVQRDNLIRVNTPARSASTVAALSWPTAGANPGPATTDPAAAFVASNITVSTALPALIPSGTAPPLLSLDVASAYRVNGAPSGNFLATGLQGLRGAPTFSPNVTIAPGAAGTVVSLARATTATRTASLNLFAIDAAGNPAAAPIALHLPAPLAAPDGFTINATSNAEFSQYRSQSIFRGPAALAAIGFDPPTARVTLAAVATDAGTEALVLARLDPANPSTSTWHVIARPGSPVLSTANGTPVGAITTAAPATLSAPALDLLGNAYFVASWTPTDGSPGQALIKAVRTTTGYALERILASGTTFTGANSAIACTITKLHLADSDSIASGAFHAGSIVQTQPFATPTADPAKPSAAGGLAVNAVITYATTPPQTYEATLFVSAITPGPLCPADLTSDNRVDTADLVALLGRFGQSGTPGAPADFNADGTVNTADLVTLLGNFGCGP